MADELQVGDLVRLKPKSLDSLGLKDHMLQGGEGSILRSMEDAKGVLYVVRLARTGKTRMARTEDLVIHRKKKGNRRC